MTIRHLVMKISKVKKMQTSLVGNHPLGPKLGMKILSLGSSMFKKTVAKTKYFLPTIINVVQPILVI
jgi:hypothetical protein